MPANTEKPTIGLTAHQMDAARDATDASTDTIAEGQEFMEAEKKQSQKSSLRTHWKGAFFSIALSCALVMEGEQANPMIR